MNDEIRLCYFKRGRRQVRLPSQGALFVAAARLQGGLAKSPAAREVATRLRRSPVFVRAAAQALVALAVVHPVWGEQPDRRRQRARRQQAQPDYCNGSPPHL